MHVKSPSAFEPRMIMTPHSRHTGKTPPPFSISHQKLSQLHQSDIITMSISFHHFINQSSSLSNQSVITNLSISHHHFINQSSPLLSISHIIAISISHQHISMLKPSSLYQSQSCPCAIIICIQWPWVLLSNASLLPTKSSNTI